MLQFVVFALWSFLGVWINLFFWGFTAGPANAAPYFELIGDLIILLVAAPMTLFVPRLAACVALGGSAFVVLSPLTFGAPGFDLTGVMVAIVLAAVVPVVATIYIWRTRSQDWLTLRKSPRLLVRVPVALIPIVAFVILFNTPLVFQLLVAGPPR